MKDKRIRIAMAQVDSVVGDIAGNVEQMISFMERARDGGADLVIFPELSLTGYPPEDLVFKTAFIDDNLAALRRVAEASCGLTVIAGFIDRQADIFNAAALLHDGEIAGVYHKRFLPDYGVFDESRYFRAGTDDLIFSLCGINFGVTICEDIWYPAQPLLGLASRGADMVLNISASPYHIGKALHRERMLSVRASDYLMAIAYVNAVGGQDELVFDGSSMIFDERGRLMARAKPFAEDLCLADVNLGDILHQRLLESRWRKLDLPAAGKPEGIIHLEDARRPVIPVPPCPAAESLPDEMEAVRLALTLGLGDYVRKNGFSTVVIGLSGGIDSAVVVVLAAQALGADNVKCVFMPSPYSADISREGSEALCRNLGIDMMELPIEDILQSYLHELAPAFAGRKPGLAGENLQARIRGNLLFALSNEFGWLVVSTGNKSEMSVGYGTLYGDMAGGFALIKDLPKGMVYSLAAHLNRMEEIIPQAIIDRAPSAELRPGQLDTDSLPPYDLLDPILEAYIEREMSIDDIDFAPREQVVRVAAMVSRSEYKRRQAPPGPKITGRAFGRDRRYPITNKYR